MTVAVIVHVTSHDGGVVRVTVGGLSLQLWTSSLADEELLEPLLLVPTEFLPPLKISAFQEAAFVPVTLSLASGGVHVVATLFDTLSRTWVDFLA